MHRRLTPVPVLLRAAGFAALLLLVWNPVSSRFRAPPGDLPALVLLDASLSMDGRWRAALDTARRLAHGGVIWRFGAGVAAFDSGPPGEGASHLAPALEAAAARAGRLILVTDGEIADLAEVPPDLLRRPQVVLLPRRPFADAFVAGVEGPRRVSARDTIRLRVSYGAAGRREAGGGRRTARLSVGVAGRRLVSRALALPDSGIVSVELPTPASRLPTGWSALEVRLEGVSDAEPRDDARIHVLEVSPQPAAVLLTAPPAWEMRFLARALGEVARVPMQVFVEIASEGEDRWRDGTTLAPVSLAKVQRAVDGARLVVLGGEPARWARFRPRGAVLAWPAARRFDGDWYVLPPAASPLAGTLAGIPWDSLPPATAVLEIPPDTAAVVALTARLARHGAPRPVVVLTETGGARRATVTATGLWRWAFRGGAAGVAYRALVAGLADWLLDPGAPGTAALAVPEQFETANGLPLRWRWRGAGPPRDLPIRLRGAPGVLLDTLRFDAGGRAELRLPPGGYRYAFREGEGAGVVAVEEYSDEWRPSRPVLAAQGGQPAGRQETVGMRDRWWLFVLAIAAFAAEWAWRRRQGLP